MYEYNYIKTKNRCIVSGILLMNVLLYAWGIDGSEESRHV